MKIMTILSLDPNFLNATNSAKSSSYDLEKVHSNMNIIVLNIINVNITVKIRKKMFDLVTETWNPITGCLHNCVYCWARRLALTKLRMLPRYRDGFVPRFNENELKRGFKPDTMVFCCDMGDIFSPGVRDEWVYKVLEHIAKYPKTLFLLLTKNPERYKDFLSVMPRNVILGATIETDNDELYLQHKISQAPLPSQRIKAMKQLQWNLKMVSIEPILDFTDRFVDEIVSINPILVYIGYDNYNNRLPEPPQRKTLSLIRELQKRGLIVRKKTIRLAWFEQ